MKHLMAHVSICHWAVLFPFALLFKLPMGLQTFTLEEEESLHSGQVANSQWTLVKTSWAASACMMNDIWCSQKLCGGHGGHHRGNSKACQEGGQAFYTYDYQLGCEGSP